MPTEYLRLLDGCRLLPVIQNNIILMYANPIIL